MAASLETNKTLAALLTAGIIASGSGVVSRMLYHPHVPEENAYVIEVPEAAAQKGEAATPEAVPLPALLAKANPEKGASEARKCAACHSEEKGGAIKIGPPLWGVVGRDIASVEGFEYSEALRSKEGQWTFENIFEFIHGPKAWAPGTKMTFAGIKSPEDRADLLVYLRTLSDQPVPLPEAAAAEAAPGTEQAAAQEPAAAPSEQAEAGQQTAAQEPAAAPSEQAEAGQQTAAKEPPSEQAKAGRQTAAKEPAASSEQAKAGQQTAAKEPAAESAAPAGAAPSGAAGGVAALLAHADPGAGAKDARKCAACHNFEEGGPAKIGPPLWGVIGRDIASVEGFTYSDALTGKEGAWDYQKLDAFLAEPRGWARGTKMAFAGVKKPEERADVILYLRSLSHDPAPLP
jgi:cytochrome c